MQRIYIYGNSGSGKSTLAHHLSQKLEVPAIHLDEHHWQPSWVKPDIADFRSAVTNLVSPQAWVIEGAYDKVADIIASKADLVIVLQISKWACLFRAMRRQLLSVGKELPFMAKGCPINKQSWRATLDFALWIINFDKIKTPEFLEKVSQIGAMDKIRVLKSKRDIEMFLAEAVDSNRSPY